MAVISIVIPAYNRGDVISLTLDSVLAQTYCDWECIVVDDHSTDNTVDVIKSYCEKDNRFKCLVNSRKKGAQGARNTGILASTTEWICIFDSDDYMHPDYLEKMAPKISDDVDVVCCWCNKINQSEGVSEVLKWGGNGRIIKDLLRSKTYVGYDSAIIRKLALFEIGLLDEDIKAYQEYDTHIRLSCVCNYASVQEPLFDYYVGSASTISQQSLKTRVERNAKVVCKNCKLWRKYAYWNLLGKTLGFYFEVDNSCRKELVSCVPEALPLLPLYWVLLKCKTLLG